MMPYRFPMHNATSQTMNLFLYAHSTTTWILLQPASETAPDRDDPGLWWFQESITLNQVMRVAQ